MKFLRTPLAYDPYDPSIFYLVYIRTTLGWFSDYKDTTTEFYNGRSIWKMRV